MVTSLKDKKIIEIAEKSLLKYKLCDHCLGRIFAKVETGLTNNTRGKTLRKSLNNNYETKIDSCWLCSGLIGEINHFVDLISEAIKDYEFDTFLIGSKIDDEISTREEELYDFVGNDFAEPIKTELNREIGKKLEVKLPQEVDFENPTIMVILDTVFDIVDLQIKSLFVYGRYNKFRRDIPQTKWFCRICRGKGCRNCNYKGKLYETSVEELISKKIMDETQGTDESFHGSGREDVDVLMLGNGRPFVLEINNPKIRTFDLKRLEKEINNSNKSKIKVNNLRFSDKKEVVRIKNAQFKKTYRAVIIGKRPINKENLKKATASLQDKIISQFTPSRVAHRRANTVRKRYVYNCSIESIDDTIAKLIIEAESGTYIKELISGDDGKTNPNISDLIKIPCKVKELDVINIQGE